jgi:hypothetical protein
LPNSTYHSDSRFTDTGRLAISSTCDTDVSTCDADVSARDADVSARDANVDRYRDCYIYTNGDIYSDSDSNSDGDGDGDRHSHSHSHGHAGKYSDTKPSTGQLCPKFRLLDESSRSLVYGDYPTRMRYLFAVSSNRDHASQRR